MPLLLSAFVNKLVISFCHDNCLCSGHLGSHSLTSSGFWKSFQILVVFHFRFLTVLPYCAVSIYDSRDCGKELNCYTLYIYINKKVIDSHACK